MCTDCGCGTDGMVLKDSIAVELMTDILSENRNEADSNRRHLESHNILAVNLMGSPGAGKTSLIESTIDHIGKELGIGVIEGDLETENDAERIRAKGAPAFQITTGTACHLDASMVHKGIHHMPLYELDLLFIENVGNLVCPASFDVGAHINVVLLSVTEGDDKPLKYPVMFRVADAVVITKRDLEPHCDFNVERALENARKLRPDVKSFSKGKNGEGSFDEWIAFLKASLEGLRNERKYEKSASRA